MVRPSAPPIIFPKLSGLNLFIKLANPSMVSLNGPFKNSTNLSTPGTIADKKSTFIFSNADCTPLIASLKGPKTLFTLACSACCSLTASMLCPVMRANCSMLTPSSLNAPIPNLNTSGSGKFALKFLPVCPNEPRMSVADCPLSTSPLKFFNTLTNSLLVPINNCPKSPKPMPVAMIDLACSASAGLTFANEATSKFACVL